MRANITGLLQTSDDQPYVDINALKASVDGIWPKIPVVYQSVTSIASVSSLSPSEASYLYKGKMVCIEDTDANYFALFLIVGATSVNNQTKLTMVPITRQPKTSALYGGWDVTPLNTSPPSDPIADYLLKSGGTMTGALTLSGAPTENLHAATKAYVDTAIGAGTGNFLSIVLLKSGGTMTGNLTLSADPSSDLHAATKKYVDRNKVKFLTTAEINALPTGMTVQEAIDAYKGNIIVNSDSTTAYLIYNVSTISGATQLTLVPMTRQGIDTINTPLS